MRRIRRFILCKICLLCVLSVLLLLSARAYAECEPCVMCTVTDCALATAAIKEIFASNQDTLINMLSDKMQELREWYVGDFFEKTLLPDLRLMARESGISVRETEKHMAELMQANLIIREKVLKNKFRNKIIEDNKLPSTPQANVMGGTITALAYLAGGHKTLESPGYGSPDNPGSPHIQKATFVSYAMENITNPPGHDGDANLAREMNAHCAPGSPLCSNKNVTDPRKTAFFSGESIITTETTIPLSTMDLALEEMRIASTPKSSGLSAAEIAENPEILLKKEERNAFASLVIHSGAETAALRFPIPGDDPSHVAANVPNEDLWKKMTGGEGKPSKLAIMKALALQADEGKTISAVLGSGGPNVERAQLAAAVLENMIEYERYRSQRRQELLVAGILMYEIMAHKKWMEQYEALLIAQNTHNPTLMAKKGETTP